MAPSEPNQPHSSDEADDQGDEPFAVLLDQNVPRAICAWLLEEHRGWRVWHAVDVGLAGKSDRQVYEWAQTAHALIVTFDEDFADQRAFPVGHHHGVVRPGSCQSRHRADTHTSATRSASRKASANARRASHQAPGAGREAGDRAWRPPKVPPPADLDRRKARMPFGEYVTTKNFKW